MNCTRCDGTGFINLDQVDEETLGRFDETGDHQVILDWIADRNRRMKEAGGCSCNISPPCHYCVELVHDVAPCDCCGDGENWYGEPGKHYGRDDQPGDHGPYTYNGGLCECH